MNDEHHEERPLQRLSRRERFEVRRAIYNGSAVKDSALAAVAPAHTRQLTAPPPRASTRWLLLAPDPPQTRRRWSSGRAGWTVLVLFWLFVSGAVLASTAPGGIAFFLAGLIYFAGDIWIARSGGRHSTFVVIWRLFWHF